ARQIHHVGKRAVRTYASGLGVAVRPHDAPPLRSTRARDRRWPTSTATPPVLVACRQPWPPNTSHARTCAGAKTRWLDSVFAHCSALYLLSFSRGFVTPPLGGGSGGQFLSALRPGEPAGGSAGNNTVAAVHGVRLHGRNRRSAPARRGGRSRRSYRRLAGA